ncbi:hypothetical protein SLEP1_g53607 [Rubroshorea leprosula]|uniref:Uncharacterized protein n=1 Tax=Rubroshorea leprosula TaxID=152421 RepID=A0AAV5MDT2_9ROSI|nr:hypothetical protein SLEP1_g53607 [Rubroshorea leprosula]
MSRNKCICLLDTPSLETSLFVVWMQKKYGSLLDGLVVYIF